MLKTPRNSEVLIVVQWVRNPTSIHEDVGSIPDLAQWVKGSGVAMSSGVVHRHDLDPVCRELWCRLQMRLRFCVAVAVL